jgi:hypothetical protein
MKENYSANYVAAMDAANAELDSLFEEARRLRNRMEQIDTVVNALKPLMPGSESAQGQEANSNSSKQKIDAALDLVFA